MPLPSTEDVHRTILPAIAAGVIAIDTAGIIVEMNPAAEALTDWPAPEAIGRPWDEVVDFPEGATVLARKDKTLPPSAREAHEPINIEGHLVPRSGESPLAVLLQQLPWFDEGGQWLGYIYTLHDMSYIQDQMRLREELLSNIAHEFRTPLASLVASTEMLSTEHHEMSVAEIDHLLRSLHRSIRRLESLVNNILDEASLRAGRFQVYPEPVELGDIIDEAVLFIQPMLDQRQQALDIHLATDMGAVRADEGRIAQVLINLLDNASKYGPQGQTIVLRAVMEPAHALISIRDHGPGIPPEQHSALFQRYSRLTKPGLSSSGTGLGLAIAKAIVERHGGEIGLESKDGAGTRVWFTLPRVQED